MAWVIPPAPVVRCAPADLCTPSPLHSAGPAASPAPGRRWRRGRGVTASAATATLAVALAGAMALGPAATNTAAQVVQDTPESPATHGAPTYAIAADGERLPWPGDDRAALAIPTALWDAARAALAQSHRRIGYTRDEMDPYGSLAHRLMSIELLFADAAVLPRESGRITDGLLNAARGTLTSDPGFGSQGEAVPGPAEVVRLAYVLTDVRAGRGYRVPGLLPPLPLPTAPEGGTDGAAAPSESAEQAARRQALSAQLGPGATAAWGVDFIPETATPADAIRHILAITGDGREQALASSGFLDLPIAVQRLAVRLYIAARVADPWLTVAFRDAEARLGLSTGAPSDAGGASPADLYQFVVQPWDDTLAGIADPVALTDSLRLLDGVDRTALAYASILYLTHVQHAIDEYRASTAGADAASLPETGPEGVAIDTHLGRIRLYGAADHAIAASEDGRDLFTVDLGGNDTWRGSLGRSGGVRQRTSAAIDFSGNDVFGDGTEVGAFGCGLLGIGLLWDAGGNDRYQVRESALGCGWYGTGVLVDAGGDDAYLVDRGWSEGHAVGGVAAAIDLSGNDLHSCGFESQAHGSTLAAAVLIDLEGDDSYVARDDGRVSALYLNQSVAMAQGCGHGRRADLDRGGHSLAGGWGVLVDGAGNDRYHSQVWSQGAGYWWGIGILEDRGGNDEYRNGKYSLGAAAHFAIGVQVDLNGDDQYNVNNDTAVNQYHGHARDGSIGVAVDGDGNDRYRFRNHCGGSSDLGSIGLFWDRRGADVYLYEPNDFGPANGWAETPPMGSATVYPLFRSFRDEIMSIGVFLDTGGDDQYPAGFERIGWSDDAAWQRNRGPLSWSWAWDGELWQQ